MKKNSINHFDDGNYTYVLCTSVCSEPRRDNSGKTKSYKQNRNS